MFRYVALAGAILVSFTSCLSKTNTSSTIGDALLVEVATLFMVIVILLMGV